MSDDDLVAEVLAALEARGAPEGMALAALLRVEQDLMDALQIIRQQIDAVVRRTRPSELG